MARTASWYRQRPFRVEAIQLTGSDVVLAVAAFLGAPTVHPTEQHVEFFGTPRGTMVIDWGDWAVRIGDAVYEVVPAPLFALVYEPSVL